MPQLSEISRGNHYQGKIDSKVTYMDTYKPKILIVKLWRFLNTSHAHIIGPLRVWDSLDIRAKATQLSEGNRFGNINYHINGEKQKNLLCVTRDLGKFWKPVRLFVHDHF